MANQIQKYTSEGLMTYISEKPVQGKFEQIMGKAKAQQFFMNVMSAVTQNPKLAECSFDSLLNACAISASMNLPINSALGKSHIIPYWNKAKGCHDASWQISWKGLVELAIRTGQYTHINTTVVYEGQIKSQNPFTGDYEFQVQKTSNVVIGYVAYIKLRDGFEKFMYIDIETMHAHAKRYSKSFSGQYAQSSLWATDFDMMAQKTVLKLLLGKYGLLSAEIETAITADQSIVADMKGLNDINVNYIDNPAVDGQAKVIDANGNTVTVSEKAMNVGEKAAKEAMKKTTTTAPPSMVPAVEIKPSVGFEPGDLLVSKRNEDQVKAFGALYASHEVLSKWSTVKEKLSMIRPNAQITKSGYFYWVSEKLHNEIVEYSSAQSDAVNEEEGEAQDDGAENWNIPQD